MGRKSAVNFQVLKACALHPTVSSMMGTNKNKIHSASPAVDATQRWSQPEACEHSINNSPLFVALFIVHCIKKKKDALTYHSYNYVSLILHAVPNFDMDWHKASSSSALPTVYNPTVHVHKHRFLQADRHLQQN